MFKNITSAVLSFSFFLMGRAAFAAGDNILVTGTNAFLSDLLKWILILIPVSAAVVIAYQSWAKKGTDEPAEIAAKDKLIKKYLIGAIIGECSAAVVKLVLSYYGVTANI